MSEISYSYIVEYLRALHASPTSPILSEIETQIATGAETSPIIRPEVADFMGVQLSLIQPSTILEIGTAVGYSSILMSEHLKEGGKITTLERFPYMAHDRQSPPAQVSLPQQHRFGNNGLCFRFPLLRENPCHDKS